MVPGFGVTAECQSIGTSGKKQRACYQPQKLSVGAYFELSFLGCGFLIHLPTGPTVLDSEPHGRRYAKNTGHDRNRLYLRAIHCLASMEKHYIQWFLLKSVWFPYSSFQQVRQPSIPSPMEEDTSKIWDTTGTVFIQGPSIVLLVCQMEPLNIMLLHTNRTMDGP